MIRVFLYLLAVTAAAIGFAWFADQPGLLVIELETWHIDISLFAAVVITLLTVAVVLFVLRVVRKIAGGPGRLSHHLVQRRISRGYDALRKGMFAVGAGDETLAARYAAEARRALTDEPLTQLLLAQSAQLSGDRRTAQRIFEAMVDKPDTQLLGLRGLFLEASRDKQMEAARQFAARAMALNPALPWPVHSLFEMQCRDRDWRGALETLAVARQQRHLDRKTIDRRRAVLLTAQASELEETQPEKAAELALEAHKLLPGFVPAAHIAGRILASRDSAHKAARVLAKTWQYTPHPDLATTYAYVRPGDSPRDRLARVKSLIILTPDHPEARIALASAAIDARDWEEARAALQPLIANNPTARVCTLMARIEGGEKRDAGRVREWLARAVRAPRDALWIADGVASEEWSPISPVTGAFDAFEWRVPADRPKAKANDLFVEEISALGSDFEGATRSGASMGLAAGDANSPAVQTITINLSAREMGVPVDASAMRPTMNVSASADAASSKEPRKPAAAQPDSTKLVRVSQPGDTRTAVAPPTAEATPAKPPRKIETRIFIPDRPPDDPGPGVADVDDASTPVTRFRTASKQPGS